MVEAVRDPAIPNVVCHVAYFDRSVLDRLRQGNWFENPSNSSVSCQRIGPIDLAGVRTTQAGQEIFNQRQSLFFKNVAVRRIVVWRTHLSFTLPIRVKSSKAPPRST
jgi:CreA protein